MPKLVVPHAPLVYSNAKPKDRAYLISDGRGLNMLVTPDGSKLWVFRYTLDGRQKKISIKGGYPAVSVKAAREEAERYRALLAQGEDPGVVRKAGQEEKTRQEEKARLEAQRKAATFESVAREWHTKASEHLVPSSALVTLHRLEKDIFPCSSLVGRVRTGVPLRGGHRIDRKRSVP